MRRKQDGRDSPNVLFDAIVAANLSAARKVLADEPALVAYTVPADRLIESIPHWMYFGDTPLHLAAAALKDRIVDLLLERGANPRAINRRGASPLHYVCDPRPHARGVWNPESQARIIDRLVD